MLQEKLHFLQKVLGKSKYYESTKEAIFYCPFCNHHKPKLSVNIESDRWQCWNASCQQKGKRLIYLVKKNGTSSEIKDYISRFSSLVFKQSKELVDFSVSLPEGYMPIHPHRNSFIASRAMKYLTKIRGLSEETVLNYKIGTIESGEHFGSVVLPSFDKDGSLNFYTIRHLEGGYFNPNVPRGYKNDIVMNELNIDWNKPVVLVEGFFDMLKSSRNTVPLFGSSLSEESLLFEKIVLNNTKVFLSLDEDARDKAINIARKLIRYNVDVSIVDLTGCKDPGSLSKESFAARIAASDKVDREYIFKSRLRKMIV